MVYTNPQISVSPNAISLIDGATITISGSGFYPNSSGSITANNQFISGFTADSNGNFSVSVTYNIGYGGLYWALQDASGNFVDIVAFDFFNGASSNTEPLYFDTSVFNIPSNTTSTINNPITISNPDSLSSSNNTTTSDNTTPSNTTPSNTASSTSNTSTSAVINSVSVNNGVFTVTGSGFGTQPTGIHTFSSNIFSFNTPSFEAGVNGNYIEVDILEWNDTTVEFTLEFGYSNYNIPNGTECTISINGSAPYTFTYNGSTLSASTSTSPSTSPSTTPSSSSTTSSSTSTSQDTIMQFVYYYPPSEMTPEDISAIGGDGYYGFILVNIDLGSIAGTNIVFMPNANQTAQFVITPEAYTTWYNNNLQQAQENTTLQTIYTAESEPVNGYENANAEVTAYLEKQGFYWKPYVSNYASLYNVDSSAINPVNEGLSSDNLYMLIRSASASSQATGNNGLATSSSLSQGASENQTSQEQQAIQNQQNNTQSLASEAGSAINNAIKPLIPNIDLGLIILGAFVLLAVFVYAYGSHIGK